MSRRIAALAATLLAALVVGCGEDESDSPESAGSEESSTEPVVIEAEKGAFNAHAVYESAAPSVVTVISVFPEGTSPLAGSGRQIGEGSGFVISEEGEIVTNAHVVTDGEAQGTGDINEADEVYVQFPDQNKVEADVVGFDPFADVALLEVDPEGLALDPIELGDIEDAEVGDPVAAIGSPFSQRQSLSVGVISATDRSIPSLTRFSIDGAIQTDASINPGNSGGPLLDAEARVLGINQQIDTTSGGNQGVGFAVPVDLVARAIEQLRSDGEVTYAFLGVTTSPVYPQLADRLGIDAESGALIQEVSADSPAEEAGLRAGDDRQVFQGIPYTIGGDVIVEADGRPIVGESDLSRLVSRAEPGEEIELRVIRGDEEIDVTVTPAPREVDSGTG